MEFTLHLTVHHTTGPDATPAEIQAQLIEEIASISQFTVEHSAEDGSTNCADYTIETVRPTQDEP